MPPFVLTILKVALLALLYFFIYRAVRAIAADVYGARAPRPPKAQRRAEPRGKPARRGKGTPTRVVVMREGAGRSASHRLAGSLDIGRADGCQIKLGDTYASQQHARISQRNGAWVVEDLGSTNGTYLNQRKVTVPTEIEPGDRIRIGKTIIEVRK